jgi:LCP family protein required for cell wall assembly
MRRRVLAVTMALTAWVAGTLTGSLGTAPATGMPMLQVGRAHAEFQPTLTGSDPIFVLVLGSDAREGTPLDGGLADSIHLLGINPAAGRATLFGIPRDAWVPLASGGTNKINAAMPAGGVEAQIATVEQLTGIAFDYYALTGFDGFIDAVSGIGGISVDVPYTVEGYATTFPPGEQELRGSQALDFARTRKSLPRGDFDRSLHQGLLMVSALEQFRAEYTKNAARMFTWIGSGLRNVSTDLSVDELTRLANLSLEVKPVNVTNLVATGTVGNEGGMSVVYLSDENQALWADMAADGYILPKAISPEHEIQAP